MYYFNYQQHFWVDNLLYGEYKRDTIENDFNILTYDELKEKYKMVWFDIICCCVILSRNNIVIKWLNYNVPYNNNINDLQKIAYNACIYGNIKIIKLLYQYIPIELNNNITLFSRIFKRGEIDTIRMYYNLYPDQLIYLNKIKISYIISSGNIILAKYYMDNVSDINIDSISFHINNCFYGYQQYSKCFLIKFNVLKYILLHQKSHPYLDINTINRLQLIMIRKSNRIRYYYFTKLILKICKIIKYNPYIKMYINSYNFYIRCPYLGYRFETSLGNLSNCKTIII